MCFKKLFGWFKKTKKDEISDSNDSNEKMSNNDLFQSEEDFEIKKNLENDTEDFVPSIKEEENEVTEDNYIVNKDDKVIKVYAPCDGVVKEMKFIQDQVFKQNLLGEGLFIIPEYQKDQEKLAFYAPVSGEIVNLFHIGHYYTIREKFQGTDSYQDFVIHIGIDSVEAGEEAFFKKVNQSDHVTHNDVLCEIDIKKLLENATSIDTPILVSAETLPNCKIINKRTGQVKRGDLIFEVLHLK
ncbi:PTS glucose transporter subunit IIA [symbiont of Argiope bruennichi]|uniref:PTS sugar transporter subunit IIA n=1 Tax=symbiont of Argiope bruennichi TaxID=2810479 RepID=UPI003DA3F195